MIPRFTQLVSLMFVLLMLFVNTTEAAQPKADVRILVDVSGSMKRNDPENLRIPAVRLISGILPNASRAAVWMFAEDVQSLTPVATVSGSSKKQIYGLAKKIHNRGLFTNIGSALETATADWIDTKSSDQRIVILLTDGVVDVSKDGEINKRERARIQQQLIPDLKKLNARIYTIALSEDADKELLAQLSNSTDAWFEAVKNAAQLEKVFLKIFEQSVNVPSLPLTDNKFKVDASINEFTALIFRNSSDPITLISPSGKKYEADTLGSKISWYEEVNFDLVTIRLPEDGEWKIEGPVDPDNRVMIVSDLALDVNNDELPANMLSGESLQLKMSLQEKGNIIKRATFLSLINFGGEVSSVSGAIDEQLILEDGGENGDKKSADGIFGYQFTAPKIDEEVTFKLKVSSPTFERVYRRSVRIFSTYAKFHTTVAESIEQFHRLEVQPLSTVVNEDSLSVKGVLKMPDGSELDLNFSKTENGTLFTEIPADNLGGTYTALLDIEGEILSGKKFTQTQKEVSFEAAAFETDEVPLETTEPEEKEQSEQEEEETPVEKTVEEVAEEADITENSEADMDTMTWMIIGIVFNLIVFGGAFFGWKKWKKKQITSGDELAAGLDDDEVAQPKDKKAEKNPKKEKNKKQDKS